MERCASSSLVKYGYGLQADSTTAGGRQGEAVVAAVLGWGGGRGCPSGNLQTDVSDDTRAGRDATVCIYS